MNELSRGAVYNSDIKNYGTFLILSCLGSKLRELGFKETQGEDISI